MPVPQVELEIVKEVPITRCTSTSSTSKRVRRVSRNLIVFGVLSAVTLAIVSGMSIYVVHNTEVRFKTRVGRLLDDSGHEISTVRSERAVPLTYAALTAGVLAHLQRVNLRTADDDLIGWDVVGYEKHAADGIIVLHGPDDRFLTVNDGSEAALVALQQGWDELGLEHAAAQQAAAVGRRGRMLLSQHGRLLQVSSGEGIAPDANTDGSGAPLEVPPPTPFPDDAAILSYTDGCTQGDVRSFVGGRNTNPQSSPKPCNCLKREFWSDPAQNTCAKRPAASETQYTSAYLDLWAFEGDDCSAKPCFNFDANTRVPFEEDYQGNAAFQAAYPNKAYTGRTSTNGFSSFNPDGTGAGQLEALHCRGRITVDRPWWHWSGDEYEYKCVLRSSDDYTSRRTPCSCPWWNFLGCTGTSVHTHNPDGLGPVCGKRGECFLTAQDGNKYCQPRVGQDPSAYA